MHEHVSGEKQVRHTEPYQSDAIQAWCVSYGVCRNVSASGDRMSVVSEHVSVAMVNWCVVTLSLYGFGHAVTESV